MTWAPLPSAVWWHQAFAATVAEHGAVELDRAAVLLSAYGSDLVRDPDDVDATLRSLDALADEVRAHVGPRNLFEAWHHTLFVEHGFTGDNDTYHDVRNSFLPDVLQRRRGIPISLAVLGIEVARRVGLPMWGVGMPGHFLIGRPLDGDGEPRGIHTWQGNDEVSVAFVDPFNAGELLDVRGCVLRFARLFGPGRSLEAEHLDPVEHETILVRMLANLKQNEARRRDLPALASIMRMRLALWPVTLDEHREAIRLFDATGAIDEAMWALEQALSVHGPSTALDDERRRLAARLS